MINKVFVIVGLVCFIKGTKGDDISDLIKELAPKIKEAALRASDITVVVGDNVTTVFLQIQQELNVYEKDLVGGKVNLFKVVYQAIIDAKKSGKDISNCISDVLAAAKDLIGWNFEACRISKELNDVTVDLLELTKSEFALLFAPVECTVQSDGDLEKLRACILDVIDGVNKQSDKIETEIDSSVSVALEKAKQCGSDRSAELSDLITSVTNNFNDCVSKA